MQRNSFAELECPIARAADQIGDGWSLLIIRNALLGARTFQEFEERLEIPASTLSRRLALLCERGLLRRERYRARPARDAYLLTDKGLELLPVVLALAAWGNRWLAPKGVAIQPIDAQSCAPIDPVLVDRRTGRPLVPKGVALAAGPAASKALRTALRKPRVLGAYVEEVTT